MYSTISTVHIPPIQKGDEVDHVRQKANIFAEDQSSNQRRFFMHTKLAIFHQNSMFLLTETAKSRIPNRI